MTDLRQPIFVLEQRLASIKRTPPSRRPKDLCETCKVMREAIRILEKESEV